MSGTMGRDYYSIFGVIICLGSLSWLFSIEWQIYDDYMRTSGKARALFGINELAYLNKLLLSIGGILGFICAFLAYRRNEHKGVIRILMVLALITMLLPFFKVWSWFVPEI
ncbi:MAG: hypothetical protein Aureis2KO_16600 [Aureisphaera sp.]